MIRYIFCANPESLKAFRITYIDSIFILMIGNIIKEGNNLNIYKNINDYNEILFLLYLQII